MGLTQIAESAGTYKAAASLFEDGFEVINSVAVAVVVVGPLMVLCVMIVVCLRGTTPQERPAILRSLAGVLRSLWPWRTSTSQISRHGHEASSANRASVQAGDRRAGRRH